MTVLSVSIDRQQTSDRPWLYKPGQSGNPRGRPKGSRNKLQECFLADLHEDYQQHGRKAIVEVREKKPEVYLHAIVSLIPKQVETVDSQLSDLTDDELDQLTRYLEVIRSAPDGSEVREIPPAKREPAK